MLGMEFGHLLEAALSLLRRKSRFIGLWDYG